MPRDSRLDAVGMLHHVMNRGVGRRPILERPDDYRYFKVLLARAVRASRIWVHCFSVMGNHFHLLVESCDGQLGETMRRLQALFAGRFNRARNAHHPGLLFGARFKSFPIQGRQGTSSGGPTPPALIPVNVGCSRGRPTA